MLRALESNWENLVTKARPLLDPRDIGRPNLGIIPIINFLAVIWVISAWVGKSTELMTVLTKTSKNLFPYSSGLTSQKPNFPNSQTRVPRLCWFSWAPKSEYDLSSPGSSSLRQNGGSGSADSSWTVWGLGCPRTAAWMVWSTWLLPWVWGFCPFGVLDSE